VAEPGGEGAGAWESVREVRKLQPILMERARELRAAVDPAERRAILRGIDDLEAQLAEHLVRQHDMSAEGLGYVAALDRERVRTAIQEARERLRGAIDERLESMRQRVSREATVQRDALRNFMRFLQGRIEGNIPALQRIEIERGLSADDAAARMWEHVDRVARQEATNQRRLNELRCSVAELRGQIDAIEAEMDGDRDVIAARDKARDLSLSRRDRRLASSEVRDLEIPYRNRIARINDQITPQRDEILLLGRPEPLRVIEAAYDPASGLLVIVRSGNELPRHVFFPPFRFATTYPGKCGMPRAVDLIQQARLPQDRGRPIYTIEGGLSYTEDGDLQHVTACQHCVVTGQMSDYLGARIVWGSGFPDGVAPDARSRPNTRTLIR
jgi:hypothetical protein